MYPKTHLIFGPLFAGLIWLFFPSISFFGFFLIVASSVLIDVDHYLYYVWLRKDWNLRRAYNWSIEIDNITLKLPVEKSREYKNFIFIFHGIEFWLILIILIPLNKIFIFILLGIAIHMALDFFEIYKRKSPPSTKLSIIYNFIKNKNRKSVNLLWEQHKKNH